jgi:nucleotide-binding universal stress UspA family protein
MYRHIIVPTDGSKLSLRAVKTAVRLAGMLGAELTAMYVIPVYAPPVYGEAMIYIPDSGRNAAKRAGQKALNGIERTANNAGIKCRTVMLASGAPWEGIIKTAKARRADLIVMASHGRSGLSGLLLGSETTKVLTHSKIPVLVCR